MDEIVSISKRPPIITLLRDRKDYSGGRERGRIAVDLYIHIVSIAPGECIQLQIHLLGSHIIGFADSDDI